MLVYFLIAISIVNTVSTAASVNTENNLLQSILVNPENKNEKSSDQNSKGNPDVPKPVSANQFSANVVEITFDIPVEKEQATKASNYWVRSTQEEKPTGIATVGKNEKLSASNSLKDDMVKVETSDESGKVYKMTFKNNIKPGAEYKIYIYFIAPKGVNIYKGENGAIIFKAK